MKAFKTDRKLLYLTTYVTMNLSDRFFQKLLELKERLPV